MKNRLLWAALFSATAFVACHKDTPSPTPTPAPPEQVSICAADGRYQPDRKIDAMINADYTGELWLWHDDELAVVADMVDCGGYTERTWFEWKNGRLASMKSSINDFPFEVEYQYSNDVLSSVQTATSGISEFSMLFTHDADNHLRTAHLDLDPALLAGLMGMSGAFPIDFEEASADVAFDWQGENVSEQRLEAYITSTMTLGEIRQVVDLEQLVGEYASLLDFLPDDTPVPLTIALHDTTSLSFDSHPNPFCGLLYQLDASVLCANNVVLMEQRAAAVITVAIATPFGELPFELPYPIPSSTQTFSYTYDSQGYPIEVYSDGNLLHSITYQTE